MRPPRLLTPVRSPFRAIVRAVAPAASELDEAGWGRVETIVEDALAARPEGVRKQFVLFVRILNGLALIRHGRALERLSRERAQRFLAKLERFPLLLIRRGVWGVRTMAYMGYYGQPDVRRAVGYRAALRGWESRGVTAGGWAGRGGRGAPEPEVLRMLGEEDTGE